MRSIPGPRVAGTEILLPQEYSATILNRTTIGYAFIEPVSLFEKNLTKAKRWGPNKNSPVLYNMLAYVVQYAVIIKDGTSRYRMTAYV